MPAAANTSTTGEANAQAPDNAQQTVMPTQPNAARDTRTQQGSRTRQAAIEDDVVPPATRGVGTSPNRPDCSQMRGIEKAECERRDTVRDDLPAGETTSQPER